MNVPFDDGRFFFNLPHCNDKKVAQKIQIDEITLAFAAESEMREVYSKFDKPTIDYCVEWLKEYRRGILYAIEKNPNAIPERLKKLVARLNK